MNPLGNTSSTCPGGHPVGTRGAHGQKCTPLWCSLRAQEQLDKTNFGECPKGHKVGTINNGMTCTPVWCGMDRNSSPGVKPEPLSASMPQAPAPVVTPPRPRVGGQKKGHKKMGLSTGLEAKFEFLAQAREGRAQLTPAPPKGLDGLSPEDYTAKKLLSLTPAAAHDLEHDLFFGDDVARRAARESILDRTGFSKSDKMLGNSAPIVIINAGGGDKPPWAGGKTIDVKAIDSNELLREASAKNPETAIVKTHS